MNGRYVEQQCDPTKRIGEESEKHFLQIDLTQLSFVVTVFGTAESNPNYDFVLFLDEDSVICDLIGAEPIFISCKSSLCGVRAGMASLSNTQAAECEFDPQRTVVINTRKKLSVELIYAQIVNNLVRLARFCSDTNEEELLTILDQTDSKLSQAYRKHKRCLTFLPPFLSVETTLGEATTESGKKSEAVDFAHLARLVESYFPGVSVQLDPYATQQPTLNPCLQKLAVHFDNGLGEKMIREAQWFLFRDGLPGSHKGRPLESNIPYYTGIISPDYTDEMLVAEFLAQLIAFHGMGEQLLLIINNPDLEPRKNLHEFVNSYGLQEAWQVLLGNYFCVDQYRTPWIQRINTHLRAATRKDTAKNRGHQHKGGNGSKREEVEVKKKPNNDRLRVRPSQTRFY